MKIINFCLMFILLSFFSFCGNNFDDNADKFKEKERVMNNNYADSLKSIIKKVLTNKKIEDVLINTVVEIFRKNEKSNPSFFPANNEDYKLYYDFLDYLKQKSKIDDQALILVSKLSLVVKRNVEASEYLMELTPNIALGNISGFVRLYEILDKTERKMIIGNLEYFKNSEDYNLFKQKLLKIENEKNKELVKEIIEKSNQYLKY